MNDAPGILVIDDDQAVLTSLSLLLKRCGYRVATANGHREAIEAARGAAASLFLLDMNFSVSTTGEEGLALLKVLKKDYPDTPVILMTAWGSIPLAVDGMKAGASDFVTKPWNNDNLLKSIATIISLSGSQDRTATDPGGRSDLDKRFDFQKLIGHDGNFVDVLRTVGRVCATDAPVLILGESGTGKELVAEAIHANSGRRDGPFVRVNLGGIPPSLFESEMFGHKKGAFTDAISDRVGRFEMAHRGTIFLDEIADLGSAGQVKLLRVAQDRTFEILGASETRTSDFRILSATNRPLEKLVAAGQFREDLYYRINLISLRLPPLRERRADIKLLVEQFIGNLKEIYDRPDMDVTPAALDWMKERSWPGNVRQLKNVVERTVLVSQGNLIDVDDFRRQLESSPSNAGTVNLPAVGTVTIDQMEKSMILKAVEYHKNNLSQVARSLGLSRAALYRRLDKYGITT